MVLKLLYTVLIGIFLAVFVGVGIAAFYPAPKYPEQASSLRYAMPEVINDSTDSAKYKLETEKFEKESKIFQEQTQLYSRNVSIIALVAAIILVVLSLTIARTLLVIPDGLLLGGVLTLIYSVIRGFGADDNMFRFIVVSIGLFLSLFLGYMKFIKSTKK